MHKSKPRTTVKRSVASVLAGWFKVVLFLVALTGVFLYTRVGKPTRVEAATPATLNFQARLMTAAGGIVADGCYNIQFKLYDASSGGSNVWTETRIDTDGATGGATTCPTPVSGNDYRVSVRAGYVSVYLGDLSSLSGLDWSKQYWLTMNVGGTTQTASPTYDGEMSPRLRLTSVPFAQAAGTLATYNSGTGFTSTLNILQPTGGNQTFQIPDQGAAGTYSLLTTNAANANYIQNQSAADQTADFRISGTGRANTSFTSPVVDALSGGTLSLGTSNATAITLGKTGVTTTSNGPLTVAQLLTGQAGATISGGNLSFTTTGASNATFTSDLSVGARSASALTVTQASNATNDNSAALVQFTNNDGGSTTPVLSVTQGSGNAAASGISISLGSFASGISISGSTGGYDISASGITTGVVFNAGATLTSGSAFNYNTTGVGLTSGSVFSTGGTATGALSAFTGNLINVVPDRVLTGTGITDTGRLQTLARTNTVNSAGQTFTVQGDVANFSSNCTQTAGTCTDSGNILELQQNYANATGAVLNVGGAGTGNLATLDATNASANGVSIDVQSNSSSQYALKVTTNNGANTAFQVNGDGSISEGVAGAVTTFNGSQITNNGATLNTSSAISDKPTGGNIGTAAATVDVKTTFDINQTTASQTLTLPNPTSATSGRMVYVNNIGSVSFNMYGSVISSGKSNAFIWNGSNWVTTVSLSGSVVNAVGTIDTQSKSSDGAVISTSAIYLQTADASFPGLVSTGVQTFAGAKTFNSTVTVAGLLTGQAGATVSGAAISLNDSSNFNVSIAGGTSTGQVDIGSGTGIQTLNFGTGGTGAKTVTVGSTASTGLTTIQAGTAGVRIQPANGTTALDVRTSGNTSVLTVDTSNSSTSVRGTNSDATLGSELVTSQAFNSANWTTCNGGAGGWTGTATTATHNTGNSVTCSAAAGNFTVTAGVTYKVAFTIASNTTSSNTVTPSIGGVSGQAIGANGTETQVITASTTGALTFSPSSSFNGVISAVSVKALTSSNAVLKAVNSAGTTALEVRATGSTTNSFVGLQAGQSNVSGTNNTGFGSTALKVNTTGTDNTAFGYGSLSNTTVGSQNTAVGSQALQFNTSGNFNVATGYQALQVNTTGFSNVATGYQALISNTSGTINTAVGTQSLLSNTTGSNNVAFGATAGNANQTGSNNSYIGYSAGYQDPTVNTFVTGTGLSNSTAIGYGSQVQASNALILGGQGANAVNVGIGTTIPLNTLSVSPDQYDTGTISQSASTTVVGSGTTFTSAMVGSQLIYADGTQDTISAFTDATHVTVGTSRTHASSAYRIHYIGLQVSNAGKVGIGTSSPSAQLQVLAQPGGSTDALVVDNAASSGNIAVFKANGTAAVTIGSTGNVTLAQNLNANGNTTLGDATTDRLTVTSQILGGTPLVFQGTTDNAFTTGFAFTDPTANNTITFPDASGTVLLAPAGSGNALVQVPTSNSGGAAGANIISPTAASIVALTVNGTTSTAATALAVAQTGTATAMTLSQSQNNDGLVITTTNASQTTASALKVTQSGTTTGFTGNLVSFTGSSTTGTGSVLGVTAVNTTAGNAINVTSNAITSGNGVNINHTTSAITSGSLLTVNSTAADAFTTGALANISSSGNFTSTANTAGLLNVSATASAAGTNVNIANSFASQTTSTLLNVVQSGVTTGYTGNVVSITGSSTTGAANVLKVVSANTTAGAALSVTANAATTSNALVVSATAITGTGSALSVDAGSGIAISAKGGGEASYGSELITSQAFNNATYWTCSTGWTAGATSATHTTGNSSTCDGTASNMTVTSGATYIVSFTVTGNSTSTETVTPSIGGVNGRAIGANTTDTQVITTASTAQFRFTPTSNFNGTISAVSVKLVTLATSQLKVVDSTSSAAINVRGNASLGSTFIGLQSGQANSTGSGDTALGAYSLLSNTTGGSNTAVGYGSLMRNTTGFSNTALGSSALVANTIGANNTAVGQQAMNSNTTGSGNSSFGQGALGANSTGSNNVAFGYVALDANTMGSGNTVLGTFAARSNTTGSNNTYIGYQAGYQDPTVSTFVTGAGLSNATAIGYGSQVQASNALILGGQGANAVNVGIGTTLPDNILSVSPYQYKTGTISQTASTTVVGSGTTFTAAMVGSKLIYADGTSDTITAFTDATHVTVNNSITHASSAYRIQYVGLQVTSAGTVGIGTTAPGTTRLVVNNQNTGNIIFDAQNNGTSALKVDGSGNTIIAGNLNANGNTTLGDATTDRLTVTSQILGGTPLVFQGATDNAFATSFAFTDPTANRTITFGDETGTVCTTAASAACTAVYASSTGNLLQAPASTAINTVTPTTANTVGLTVNATSNATGGVAAIFNQANNTVTSDTVQINTTNTSGTQTNGLLIARNGAGGTTTNLLNLTQSAGTATNALTFTGTFSKLINSTNFNVTNAGAVTAVGVDAGTGSLQGTGGLTLTGTANINSSAVTANTTIGNTSNANNTVSIQGGSTGGINVGTTAGAVPITIGNTSNTATTLIQSGTGALNIQTQGTGGINIGTNAVSQNIAIGSATGGTTTLQSSGGTFASSNFTFVKEANYTLSVDDSTTTNTAGGNLIVKAAKGSGTAAGGTLTLNGGNADSAGTGVGGGVTINAGTSFNAAGSDVTINSGGASGGSFQGGNVNINSASGLTSGNINLQTAVSFAVYGAINLNNAGGTVNAGTGASNQSFNIGTGAANKTVTIGSNTGTSAVTLQSGSGNINLNSGLGSVSITGTAPASVAGNGTAAAAALTVTGAAGGATSGTTGQTAGAGAAISITGGTGGAAGSGSTNGAGGNITLQGGAAGAGAGTASTVGNVILQGSGGKVGIGTSGTPSQLLAIGGTTGNLTVDTSGNLVTAGTIQYANGTANTNTLVCKNASGQLAACSAAALTGTAFIQSGNSFAAPAVLGTTDTNNLQVITNSVGRAVFDQSNNLFLGNGANTGASLGTAATPNDFTVQGTGSATAGTTGALLVVKGGAGATTGTGSSGGGLNLVGGAGGGSGNRNGGAVLVQGGAAVNVANGGSVTIQGGAGSTGGSITIDAGTDLGTHGTIGIGTSNAGAVTISRSGQTTTVGGALTVTQLLTGQLGLTVTGAAVSLNDSSNFGVSIAGGTSTGQVDIGTGTGVQTLNFGTGGTGAKTVTVGSTASTGLTTIQGGTAGVRIQPANGTTALDVRTSGNVSVLTVDTTNSQTNFRSINSDAVAGSELVTSQAFNSANWTTCNGGAGGWTGTATTATHNTGNTVTCSAAAGNFTVASGVTYQVSFTIASNSFTALYGVNVAIGGVTYAQKLSANTTHTVLITTSGTGALTFTPDSSFNGVISAVSVKALTSSNAAFNVKDSAGTLASSLRASATNGSLYLGLNSGNANTSGALNNGFGAYALGYNTTGNLNAAFGTGALYVNTTGSGNTAVGSGLTNYTLGQNTTGSNNAALGSMALYSNTTGSGNVALGYSAGSGNIIGSNNTFIGYGAGVQSDPDGFANIGGSLTGATAIGANAQVQANNAIVLGGTGSSAVNVGIGTTMPINTLSVSPVQYSTGTISQSGTAITGVGTTFTSAMVGARLITVFGATETITAFVDATHLTADTSQTIASTGYRLHYSGLQVTSAGNVGIGTETPGTTRLVVNNQNTGNIILDAQSNGTSALKVDGAGLTTASFGLTVSGGAVNLNTSGANVINVGTGTNTGAINIGNSAAGAIAIQSASTVGITGNTTITDLTSGVALTVNNSTSTGNILNVQDNGTNVVTVADGGAVVLQNSVNSINAFQVRNANGFNNLVSYDTTGDSANLITNATFENVSTGWAYSGTPGSIAQSTAQSFSGTGSLAITTSANANNGAKYNITLATSSTYQLTFSARLSSGSFADIIAAYAVDGVTESNCTSINTQTIFTSRWQRITCTITTTGTAPSGTPYIVIKQTAGGTARTFYIDDVKLELAGALTPFYAGLVSFASNVGINAPASSTQALTVQASHSNNGLLVKGSGSNSIFNNVFAVQDTSGTNKIAYNEGANTSIVSGGAAFYNNAALQVVTESAATRAISLKAAAAQTADLLQTLDSSGAAIARIGGTTALFGSVDQTTASTNTTDTTIRSGNATGSTSNSGNLILDVGTATQTAGTISVGTTSASAITIGRVGVTTTNSGNLTVGASAGSGTTFTNNGSTVLSTLAVANDSDGGALGGTPGSPLTAAQSVDIYSSFSISQTTTGQTITLPTPTASTTYGRRIQISNIGTASFIINGSSIVPGATADFTWANTNGGASWQFAGDGGGSGNYIQNQNASAQTANFLISGTGTANTSFTSPLFDALSGGALSVGTSNATGITIGKSGITTTNAGALTVSQLLTGNLGLTVSGAAISLNDSSNFGVSIAGGTSTGQVDIGAGTGVQTLNFGTGGTGAKTVTIGSTAGTSVTNIQGGTGTAGGDINIGDTSVNGTIVDIGVVSNTANGTVRIGTSALGAQTVSLGSSGSTSSTTINAGTGALSLQTQGTGGINIGTNAVSQPITIGNSTGGTITIGASSGSDLVLNDAQWSITGAGLITTASNAAINGGTISTTAGTGVLFNTGATAINAFGAATAINLGAAAGSTINLGGVAGTSGGTQTIQTINQSAASTNSATLAISSGNAAGATSTAGNITLDVGTSTTGNGSILIGTAARAQTITIGNTTAAQVNIQSSAGGQGGINIGTSASSQNVTIGNSTGGATRVGQNGGTLQLDGTNFDLSTAGVVTLAGGQTQDINTQVAAGAGAALTLQPGTSTGASSNGGATTIKGGDGSGTTSVTGGTLTLQGGSATGASGTRNGGNVVIGAGTGFSGNGVVSINASVNAATNINTGTSTGAVNIGNSSAGAISIQSASTIQIGNAADTGITLTAGSGANFTIDGASNSNYNFGASTTTGTITIGGTAQTGTLSIGTGTGIQALNFATGGTGAKTVTVGSTASTSALTLQAGTGNLSITTQGTGTLGVGNNAVAQILAIGNTTGATSLTQRVGTGNFSLDGVAASTYDFGTSTVAGTFALGGTAQTGTFTLGRSTATNTISIGAAAGSGNTQTINIGNSATAGSTTNVVVGSTIAGTTTLQSQGGVKVTTVGASTANSAALCRDTSTNLLTSCDTNTSAKPFIQGGNTFAALATLGTNDSNGLQLETNNTGRAYFDTTNNLYLGNANVTGGTNAAPAAFAVQGTGSSTAGTAGGALTINGGAGATTGAGSTGGILTLQGGNGGGTDIAGANLVLNGGQGTGTGNGGNVVVQVAKPGTTGSSNNSLATVATFSGTNGSLLLQNSADSTTALQLKNAAGAKVLTVDTSSVNGNLITNGSFDVNTTGWTAIGSTLSQNTTNKYRGAGSMLITTSGANQGAKYNYALAATTTYTLSMKAYSSALIGNVEIGYSADGTTYTPCFSNVILTTRWDSPSGSGAKQCTFTTGAVSGTRFIYIRHTDAASRNISIDDVVLKTGTSTGEFTNGATSIDTVVSSPVIVQTSDETSRALGVVSADGLSHSEFWSNGNLSLNNGTGASAVFMNGYGSGLGTGIVATQYRGTANAPTAVASSDVVFSVLGYGYDGTTAQNGGGLGFTVDGAVSSGVVPIGFAVNTGSSGGGTTRLNISSAGATTITGASSGAVDALTVNNSTSTGNIFVAQDNGTPVFTIADGGGVSATGKVQIGATADVGTIAQCDTSTGLVTGTCGLENVVQSVETGNITNGQNFITSITPAAASNTAQNNGTSSILLLNGSQSFTNNNYGVYGQAYGLTSAGTINQIAGVVGLAGNAGAGSTITDTIGVKAGVFQLAGTATNAYGINVISTSGTIGTNYGIKVDTQTAGTKDYGIAIAAADTQTLWLSSNAGTAASGIGFGDNGSGLADTNLYRGAAAQLNTDGDLKVGSQIAVGSTASITSNIVAEIKETYTATGIVLVGGTENAITLNAASNSGALGIANANTLTTSGTAIDYGSVIADLGQAGSTGTYLHNGTGTVARGTGLYGALNNASTGTITTGSSITGWLQNTSTGTITTANGLNVSVQNASTGTITTANGISVASATNSGTLTTNYGINVQAQTAGTKDYGIAIAAADTQTLWLSSNAGTAASGIGFGDNGSGLADTKLYRSAAGRLQTDGDLYFLKETAHTLQVADSTTAATAGGALTIKSGAGSTSGAGGLLTLQGGAGGSGTANGGAVTVQGGAGGGTNGSGGAVNIIAGNALSGSAGTSYGGAVNITSGNAAASNNQGGAMTLTTGNGTGNQAGGLLTLQAGTSSAGAGGGINIFSGNGSVSGSGGGAIAITTGSATTSGGYYGGALTLTTGNGGGGGAAGGTLTLQSGTGGTANASGGAINILSGAGGATNGAGGAIAITSGSGTASGTAGGAITITTGAGVGANNGGQLTLQGGLAGTTGAGGAIAIQAGAAAANASSTGGTVTIASGAGSTTGTGTAGASVTINSGQGGGSNANAGGTILVQAGAGSATGVGGVVTIQGGTGGATSGNGGVLNLNGGAAATSGNGGAVNINGGQAVGFSTGGAVTITGGLGLGGGAVNILGGYFGNTSAAVNIGTVGSSTKSSTINIANTSDGTSVQAISIGSAANTANAVTLSAGATGYVNLNTGQAQFTEVTGTRTLTVQTRTSNVAGSNFTIGAGTAGSGATGVAGGSLTLQGGAAAGTSGAANGGDVTITGGAGVNSGYQGIVNLSTSAFTSAAEQVISSSGVQAITAGNQNIYSTLPIRATVSGVIATLGDPGQNVMGRILYVTARDTSSDFTLRLNSARTPIDITMKANSTATLIWNGVNWTAAGASSSTDLQAAYNNTVSSAGGAELVLNAPGGNADGLTVRNNATTPISGALLEVQTSIGSNLFSINNNATEYASNGGAETSGSSSCTTNQFPANTWSPAPAGGTCARDTNAGEFTTGQASASVTTTGTQYHGIANKLSTTLTAGLRYTVSFTVKGSANFSTLEAVYSSDGTATAGNVRSCFFGAPTLTGTSGSQTTTTITGSNFTAAMVGSVIVFANGQSAYITGYTNSTTLTTSAAYSQTVTSQNYSIYTNTITTNQSTWTRVSCDFIAPSGATSSNSIFIRQNDATARSFYVDNLSVTVNASVNHAVDGSVDSALGTNWVAVGGSVTRDTTNIYDTSGAVSVAVSTTANRGVYNNLSGGGIVPTASATGVQYRASFYLKANTGTVTLNSTTPSVYYSPDGGTTKKACNDLSNTSIATTAGYTLVSCIFTTDNTTVTNARFYITNTATTDFYVDALTITLNNNTANNVQIGGANKGGPITLFTLDRSAGAPIAANNDAYLGSMYFDTSTNSIQCYGTSGWGACGAAPDNIVNLNPEYAGAVMNGSGVGTMTADFCANQTSVLSVNTSFCSSGEARNFYKWTSPQASQQTYSIYVTYQLPSTFKSFASDNTVQLTGRVDDTTNAAVTYEMFKNQSGAITACGTETTVTTSNNTWQTVGINGNEATGTGGCSFGTSAAGSFVIFKINMKANSNANAYASTLSFTTKGQ